MSNFLVVNLGLRSIRAIVFNSRGEKLASDTEQIETRVSGNEVEQDPEQWWQLATKAVRAVQHEVKSEGTKYITVTSSACNLVCVDENNTSTHPSLLVSDRRSQTEAEWVRKNAPNNIIEHNNFSASASYLFPKIIWIKRNERRSFEETSVFGTSNSYLTAKFTGQHVTDSLDAEKFYYEQTAGYPTSLLEEVGLSDENLPAVVPVGTEIGKIEEKVASELKLPSNSRFIVTTYDALAAFWGAGATDVGDAGNVCGTCSSLRVYTDDPQGINPDGDKIKVQRFERPDVAVVGGSNSLEGGLLEWAKSVLYAGDDETSDALYGKMEYDADQVPLGARGITFLPYLLGERAPFSDPDARGIFFGLERRHHRGDMMRSVFESIGFLTRHMVESIEESGASVSELKVAGGLTRRRLACQIKADVAGKPVALIEEMENTALGCMLIMANTVYDDRSLLELADDIVERKELFEPNSERHEKYSHRYHLFRDIYETNKKLFERNKKLNKESKQVKRNL